MVERDPRVCRTRTEGWLPGGGALPAPLTSFHGRVEEIRAVSAILADHRLLTITGVGGSGKTRLAVEVARAAQSSFDDGVAFVDLAVAEDADTLEQAFYTSLGLVQPDGRAQRELARLAIADRHQLILLDDCEHVTGPVRELVTELLGSSGRISVLATSREPLGVQGEARFFLQGLDTSPGAYSAASSAADLFLSRARMADPGFDCPHDSVEALVKRLDGLPLAIELAASRAVSQPVGTLIDRLDRNLDVLDDSTGSSLTATLSWSYQLLERDQQQGFRRLAVFAVPFTFDAAEAVIGASARAILARLVETSLVVPPRQYPDGEWRYRLLETVRNYGGHLLDSAEERDSTMARALSWAVQRSRHAADQLGRGAGEVGALVWMEAESENLARIINWGLEHDPLQSLEVAVALVPGWDRLLRRRQGVDILTRAVAACPTADPGLLAKAYRQLGRLNMGLIAPRQVVELFDKALSLAAPDTPVAVEAQLDKGLVVLLAEERSAKLSSSRESEVRSYAANGLSVARRIGYVPGIAATYVLVGQCSARAGDNAAARRWALRARRLEDPEITPEHARAVTRLLAQCAIFEDDATLAAAYCEEGLDEARRVGDQRLEVWFLDSLAYARVLESKWGDAARLLQEAFERSVRAGERTQLLNCIDTTAALCDALGRQAEAAMLWSYHDPFRQLEGSGSNSTPVQVRANTPNIGGTEDPETRRAAAEIGRQLDLGEAVRRCRELLSDVASSISRANQATPLTARELELIRLVASGLTDREVAAQMGISIRTVRSHLDRIAAKTGARRRADLTRLAVRRGVV